jgi:UDP-N-acetylglucosamine transferase subunit ALG13
VKERAFDKTNAFPAFLKVAKDELAVKSQWSFIIFHNAQKSESKHPRTTDNGRVFHLFVGETSWATLFPEMSIVLTHGGVGSMTDAIAAGVPQILLPTDYAPNQDYFSKVIQSKRLPIGVDLTKISIADVNAGKLVGAARITQAFADVGKSVKVYGDNIKPYQTQLAQTQTLDNTFDIIDKMCDAIISKSGAKPGSPLTPSK